MENNKAEFLKQIKNNIEKNSFHITVVTGSENPRFAYTIGNYEKFGFELILAGNQNYLYNDVVNIINGLVSKIPLNSDLSKLEIEIPDFGKFRLSAVDNSWNKKMILGVYDYYNIKEVLTYQIISDNNNFTLDIPDMSKNWNSNDIMWKWLDDNLEWNLNVPKDSQVITEVPVLFGEKVKEVTRWEENEWEAFTKNGEDVDKDNIRIISITTMLAIDQSVEPILELGLEKGLWRETENSEWKEWE